VAFATSGSECVCSVAYVVPFAVSVQLVVYVVKPVVTGAKEDVEAELELRLTLELRLELRLDVELKLVTMGVVDAVAELTSDAEVVALELWAGIETDGLYTELEAVPLYSLVTLKPEGAPPTQTPWYAAIDSGMSTMP